MGLAWQQGPLAAGSIGTFLVPDSLPARLLYAEPLRRRMRVKLGGRWIAQSDDVVLLHEPGRYPVAYFPKGDIALDILTPTDRTTSHPDLGPTAWYALRAGDRKAARSAWSTRASRRTPTSSPIASPSPGTRRTPSTKRTSGSWATPPTPTTASTSARRAVSWWCAPATP